MVVDDLLPSGFIFQSATATSGTYDQGLWTIPSMPVGTQTLSIVVVLAAPGQLSNTAELVAVSAIDPDSSPGNRNFAEDDIDTVTVTVTNGTGRRGHRTARAPCASRRRQRRARHRRR